jgi:hypothetical protein
MPGRTKPGKQESSGTKSRLSGDKEMQSRTCAILQNDKKVEIEPKFEEKLPSKGFERMPQIDPEYQVI